MFINTYCSGFQSIKRCQNLVLFTPPPLPQYKLATTPPPSEDEEEESSDEEEDGFGPKKEKVDPNDPVASEQNKLMHFLTQKAVVKHSG